MITPTRVCERCGGELFELLDGIDACLVCGTRLDPIRRGAERLAELLDGAAQFIRTYVALPLGAGDALALWVAHTHAVEAADSTPYLAITSPAKRAGKTRLLEALELLAAEPLRTANLSAAALFRLVGDSSRRRPSLLVDEVDAIFGSHGEHEELRGLLNAGHRRGAKTLRADKLGAIHEFDAFGAKALAGIGPLPDTILDRSIRVPLQRRAPHEHVARFRWREASEQAEPIRAAFAAWASDPAVIEALREARPVVPKTLDDRAADGWEPLLSIADAAGGSWPERARAAAIVLHTDGRDEADVGLLLLHHLAEVFEGQERMTTDRTLRALVDRDDGPWAVWWGTDVEAGRLKGPAARLSRLLRPFGIEPRQLRIDGEKTRGYTRQDFLPAWSRYVGTPGEEMGPDLRKQTVPSCADSRQDEGTEMPPDLRRTDVPSSTPVPTERTLGFGLDDRRKLTGIWTVGSWREVQSAAGEEPESDETRAFQRLKESLGVEEVEG